MDRPLITNVLKRNNLWVCITLYTLFSVTGSIWSPHIEHFTFNEYQLTFLSLGKTATLWMCVLNRTVAIRRRTCTRRSKLHKFHFRLFIHSFRSLSYDRSIASSKPSSPHSAFIFNFQYHRFSLTSFSSCLRPLPHLRSLSLLLPSLQ
jgi:hypothetical protein